MNCTLNTSQMGLVDMFFMSINSMSAPNQETDYDICFVYEALKRGSNILIHQVTVESLMANHLVKKYVPQNKDQFYKGSQRLRLYFLQIEQDQSHHLLKIHHLRQAKCKGF